MTTLLNFKQVLLAALSLAVVGVGWIAFAPTQLGGQASYVMLDGNSMEPEFHLGDLVVVHRQSNYQVGDIVAYRNPALQRYVFHRIIDEVGRHFILKGDHNAWSDSYQAVRNDVIGGLWFSLPRVGLWVGWIRQPLGMGIMAALLGGLLAIIVLRRQTGNEAERHKPSIAGWLGRLWNRCFGQLVSLMGPRNHGHSIQVSEEANSMNGPRRQPGNLKAWGGTVEMLFFALAFLFFVSLILAYVAFSRPLQRTVQADVPYEHVGGFSYSAPAPAGIYDANSVRSGDPIFPGLTCMLNVRFSYALAGIPADGIAGTYQLEAQILDPQSGYERTLALTEERPFSGGSFTAQAPVDLCQAEALVAGVEKQTGLQAGSYTLRFTPIVRQTGTVGRLQFTDVFEPNLDFRFNPLLFSMVRDDPQTSPLNPSRAGALKSSLTEANTLAILGGEYPIARLRLASAAGVLVSVLGSLGLGVGLSSLTRGNQAAMLQIKYASLLVEAPRGEFPAWAETIDVASVEDLARIAERHNTTILLQRLDGRQHFSVQADARTYHYALNETSAGSDSPT